MKVVYLQCEKAVRKKGELVNVSDGYVRNFLFPKKLAKEANAQALNELKNAQESQAFKFQDKRQKRHKLLQINLTEKAYLFFKSRARRKTLGSVTAKEIAEAIKKQYGVDVDKRKIDTKEGGYESIRYI